MSIFAVESDNYENIKKHINEIEISGERQLSSWQITAIAYSYFSCFWKLSLRHWSPKAYFSDCYLSTSVCLLFFIYSKAVYFFLSVTLLRLTSCRLPELFPSYSSYCTCSSSFFFLTLLYQRTSPFLSVFQWILQYCGFCDLDSKTRFISIHTTQARMSIKTSVWMFWPSSVASTVALLSRWVQRVSGTWQLYGFRVIFHFVAFALLNKRISGVETSSRQRLNLVLIERSTRQLAKKK